MVPVVLLFLLVSEAPGPEIQVLREISSPEPPQNHPRTTGTTKTHSGNSDGTGGFGGFLGFWSSLALKFGFCKKFHRQNWLEIVEGLNPEWLTPEWVLVLVLVVLVVVPVVLAVVS